MGQTAGELYDSINAALSRPRWTWRHPFRIRRYALWLNGPHIRVGDKLWWAAIQDHRGHGFTWEQVIEVKAALRPFFQSREEPVEQMIDELFGEPDFRHRR